MHGDRAIRFGRCCDQTKGCRQAKNEFDLCSRLSWQQMTAGASAVVRRIAPAISFSFDSLRDSPFIQVVPARDRQNAGREFTQFHYSTIGDRHEHIHF